jgi:hypothetical protein
MAKPKQRIVIARRGSQQEDVFLAPRHRKVTRLCPASTGSTIGVPSCSRSCQKRVVEPPAASSCISCCKRD